MRFRELTVLSGLCVTIAASADVDGFANPTKLWTTTLLGEPTKVVASVEGQSFAVCWSSGPGLMVASVHDVVTGGLDNDAALASVPALSAADMAWSPTTNRLAIGYLSVEGMKQTRLFDTTSSLPVGVDFPGDRVAFDKTGSLMVVSGSDAYLRVIDATNGDFLRAFAFSGELLDVDIDSTGGVLGACGVNGAIEAWDLASGETLFRNDPPAGETGPDLVSISISPGCTYVGSGSGETSEMVEHRGRGMVWRVADGALIYDRQIVDGGIKRVAWTDVETELVMLGTDQEGGFVLSAWDLPEDRTVTSITPSDAEQVGGVNDFDFDRSSYVWAVASGSGAVEAFVPGAICLGDLSNDGLVDGTDLATLLAEWDKGNTPSDLDGDGLVNGSDLAILIGNWGSCE